MLERFADARGPHLKHQRRWPAPPHFFSLYAAIEKYALDAYFFSPCEITVVVCTAAALRAETRSKDGGQPIEHFLVQINVSVGIGTNVCGHSENTNFAPQVTIPYKAKAVRIE
jgi:hypothetical protein